MADATFTSLASPYCLPYTHNPNGVENPSCPTGTAAIGYPANEGTGAHAFPRFPPRPLGIRIPSSATTVPSSSNVSVSVVDGPTGRGPDLTERGPEIGSLGTVGLDPAVVKALPRRGVPPPGAVAERARRVVVDAVPLGHLGESAHAAPLVALGERPVLEPLAVPDREEGIEDDDVVELGRDIRRLAGTILASNANKGTLRNVVDLGPGIFQLLNRLLVLLSNSRSIDMLN